MNMIDNEQLEEINGKYCLNGMPYTGIGEGHNATVYYKNGRFHRDNGLPAVVGKDGTKFWYVNHKLHRDNDLPAIEHENGPKSWWIHGRFHRDNGLPAIEHGNGSKSWYVNGQRIYSWDEYQKATNCSKEQLVMYILTHGDIL